MHTGPTRACPAGAALAARPGIPYTPINQAATEADPMPLYLDVHNRVPDLTDAVLRDAHQKDLAIQHKYGVKYLRYWYDEGTGKVFCLVEAPSREAAAAVHREAHGMVADEIIEVKEGI
jgi:hypothetical protein